MKNLLLLSLFIGCINFIFCQNVESDSLNRLLSTAKPDTNKVHMYWNIGASILYQDPKTALAYFKKGAALATQLNFISGMEKCHNASSLSFSINAKYDSALVYINYAIPYAIEAGNIRRLSLAYLNRADIYYNMENYGAALKDCDKAIVYAHKAKNNDGLGRIYVILNGIYRSLQQYPKAIASLDKSEYYFGLSGNRQMIAMNYSERANIFMYKNEMDKAIPLLKKAIVIADSLMDIENLAAYHMELGSVLSELGRLDEAESALNKALGYLKETGNTHQQALLYQSISQVELQKKHFSKATEYGLKAYEMIKLENDLQREQTIVASLAKIYHEFGNEKEAYKFLEISASLSDSVVRQRFSTENLQIQNSFETKEKDRSIEMLAKDKEIQQQKLKQQLLLTIALGAIALLILLGAWMLINKNRFKQRLRELELRNKIAADLHDEVGSSLSSIHMLSHMASQSTNEITNKGILEKMSANAKETMDKMSDIVWMIKPNEAESVSLKHRMERFAYEICSSKNIEVTIQLEDLGATNLSMDQKKNIYLIFKEALNNAVKYSNSSRVEVSLSKVDERLTLTIKDFGLGFDNTIVGNGNGLKNMKVRADELKAALALTSVVGEGTTLKLSVPL
jgi:signal transduction histidine kinase